MSSLEAPNIFNVKGLVAVITGGGSGIGLMMTKALALNGAAKVYIVGRRKGVLDTATKESPHGNIIPVVADVTSKDDIQKLVNHIAEETGYINVLIANSGVAGPQSQDAPQAKSLEEFQASLWKQDLDEFGNTFKVNVAGVFFCAVAFLGLLEKGNKKGNVETRSQIIMTSSIAGFNRQVPGGYAYGQSKAAVTHLTKQLATTLGPYAIRANALAPGLFPSELAGPIISSVKPTRDRIPLERIGDPQDMAGTILYLTSRAGAYLDGNIIVIDGGRLSVAPGVY